MIKTTIPPSPGESTPQAGTTQPAGKSSMPDAVLRTGMLPKAEAVRDAQEEKGAALRCANIQINGDDPGGANGNPKKRARAYWGREDEKEV